VLKTAATAVMKLNMGMVLKQFKYVVLRWNELTFPVTCSITKAISLLRWWGRSGRETIA